MQVKLAPGVEYARDVRGVLDWENAAMGVLISLHSPARDMVAAAAGSGFYEHRTVQDVTHYASGIYVLISAHATPCLHTTDRAR
ncbi:MAG: hypothetical protein ACLQU3_15315 [Limisphaerales bacterium]